MGRGVAAAFRRSDGGQDASEYGFLVAVIALTIVAGANLLAGSVGQSLQDVSDCVAFSTAASAAGSEGEGAAVRMDERPNRDGGSLADRLASRLNPERRSLRDGTRPGGSNEAQGSREAEGTGGSGPCR